MLPWTRFAKLMENAPNMSRSMHTWTFRITQSDDPYPKIKSTGHCAGYFGGPGKHLEKSFAKATKSADEERSSTCISSRKGSVSPKSSIQA